MLSAEVLLDMEYRKILLARKWMGLLESRGFEPVEQGYQEEYDQYLRDRDFSVFSESYDRLVARKGDFYLVLVSLDFKFKKTGEKEINKSTYNDVARKIARDLAEVKGIEEVTVEIFNIHIYDGVGAQPNSIDQGHTIIKTHPFGSGPDPYVRVHEWNSQTQLVNQAAHVFAPLMEYVGNIYEQYHHYEPKMDTAELDNFIRERELLLKRELKFAEGDYRITERAGKLFPERSEEDPLMRHMDFRSGDIIKLSRLITAEASISNRKTDYIIVV